MAGAEASGKTQSDLAQRVTTVALVANERSGSSDPATRCAERLRALRRRGHELRHRGGRGGGRARAPTAWWWRAATAASRPWPRPRARRAFRSPWCRRARRTTSRAGSGFPTSSRRRAALLCTGRVLRPLELGWMNHERPFVNVASAGLPAPAAERASGLEGPARPARVRGGRAYAQGSARSRSPASWTVRWSASCSRARRGRSPWRPRARSAAGADAGGGGPVRRRARGGRDRGRAAARPRGARLPPADAARVTEPPARLPRALRPRRGAGARTARDFNVDGELVTRGRPASGL